MSNLIFFDLNLAQSSAQQAPSRDEAERRFREAAAAVGVNVSGVQFDDTGDQIQRADTVDEKRGKASGWYVIHEEDGLFSGVVGNWKTGEQASFWGKDEALVTEEERARQAARRKAAELKLAEERRVATLRARALVENLRTPCPPDHPYLARKGVKPHGALLMGNQLVLPIYSTSGEVVSYQTIDGDGDKSFAYNCTSRGVYVIGASTPTVAIAEGFATAASIHELTGLRVYVTFDAGNMEALAQDIATLEAKRGAQIVIAADNDSSGRGQRAADKASEAVGGARILTPPLADTDWNDVANSEPEELRKAFADIRPLFQSWEPIDFAEIPRRRWVYGNTYIRKFCSITVAPGGLGKSTLVLTEAIAMATGRNLLGVAPEGKLKVLYFNAEDPLVELQLRVAAICLRYGIDQRELVGQLYLQSGREQEILLAKGDPGELIEVAFQRIEGFVRFFGIDVAILDPLANMHESEEDNRTYRKLGKRLSMTAELYNLAIHLVHHTKKLNGMAATVEDSRGGSALIGAVRVARAVNPMDAEEAARFGLDTHIDHFRIEPAGKNNLARPADKAEWYVREGVLVPNGDYCAVVTRWTPPDPFEGIGPEHAKRVQIALMDAEPGAWRESPQASNWVGVLIGPIVGIDPTDKGGKARLKGIIRQWVQSGVLRVEHVRDAAKGREVPVIVAGEAF